MAINKHVYHWAIAILFEVPIQCKAIWNSIAITHRYGSLKYDNFKLITITISQV